MAKPKLSIIIPVAPWDISKEDAIQSLKEIEGLKRTDEIFITYGLNPSKQRNLGIEKASGEIILFVDADSEIPKDYIQRLLRNHENYDIVGGPAETSKNERFLGKYFGCVMGSYFATQKMQSKFKGIGKLREATEKEIILCNLSIKKNLLEKYGSFNENLYPNEENELLNRLQKNKIKILYDPDLKIYRKRRKNLYKFSKQFFTYGRARMEHFLAKPEFMSILFFMPTIFTLYLISLSFYNPLWYLSPLALYILADIVSSLNIAVKENSFKSLFIVPLLFPLVHISYGLGILRGLFKRERKEGKITLEKIK